MADAAGNIKRSNAAMLLHDSAA